VAAAKRLTVGHLPRNKITRNVPRARRLRREMTLPEVLLWNRLRRAPDGVIFRRQHEIGDHVVDFYCAKARVCIEVDGIVHDMGDRPEKDEQRTAKLSAAGYEVMRVPAADVLKSPDDIADALVRYCKRG
jgi:very-short-patch-repair endonuclease